MKSVAKRGRGRPKNSGKDDNQTLQQVAALMAEKPGLGPWTAITMIARQMPEDVMRAANVKIESVVHRLNVKWRRDGAALLAAARRTREERIAAQRRAEAQAAQQRYRETVQGLAECATQVAARVAPVLLALDAGVRQTLASSQVQSVLMAVAEIQSSPAMRQVAETLASIDLHRVEIPQAVFEVARMQAAATEMLARLDTPQLAASRALLERFDMSATAEAARQIRQFG